jgi:ARG and Rhodanese-Phosphatase-superfamily-associated Protein domain
VSGWAASCAFHTLLVLLMTLMMTLPSANRRAPSDFVLVTPAMDPTPADYFERAPDRKIFWKTDPGEELDGIDGEPTPELDEPREPRDEIEPLEEVEEPSLDDAGVEEQATQEADMDAELPSIEQIEAFGVPRPAPRDVAGKEQPHQPPAKRAEAPPVKKVARNGEHVISPARSHKNLTVFLIRGKNEVKGRKFISLQEALRKKKVVVRETGSVNELTIENCSPDEYVFVQAGDMVKGGQQDRVMAMDLVLAPKSGAKAAKVFCVEQGRWSGRGGEDSRKFSGSRFTLASRELKLAARKENSQQAVWEQVARTQDRLTKSLGGSVRSGKSDTSLQLTLENPRIQRAVKDYVEKLKPIVDDQDDVVGFAFAVNGKVSSAEIYASPELFKKQWPKLLAACAIEAIAEKRAGKTAESADKFSVQECLEAVTSGKMTALPGGGRSWEGQRGVLFETGDPSRKGAWLHRSYIAKRPSTDIGAFPAKPAAPAPVRANDKVQVSFTGELKAGADTRSAKYHCPFCRKDLGAFGARKCPGCSKDIIWPTRTSCGHCGGVGGCADCKTSGRCQRCNSGPRMLFGLRPPCERCSNTGICPKCRGRSKCGFCRNGTYYIGPGSTSSTRQ